MTTEDSQKQQRVIAVIGAGAAGMMAAYQAQEQINTSGENARVVLLEKNGRLGQKVIISGGGRCNVTTGIHDVRELLKKYPRGAKFLTNAMYALPPNNVYDWFVQHGVALKTEADLRVFPQSDNGKDVVGVFERELPKLGVDVRLRTGANGITYNEADNTFTISTETISATNRRDVTAGKFVADAIIVTTGGEAYRHTGSTGEGYKFAAELGHTVTKRGTSLNSFIVQEQWPKQRSGVSFAEVGISLADDKSISATGPIVFTHQGVSGPATFVVAAGAAFRDYTKEQPMEIQLDFFPHTTEDQLRDALVVAIEQQPKEQLKKTLHATAKRLLQSAQDHVAGVDVNELLIPASVIESMLEALSIPINQLNAETSKKQRNAIVQWLKYCALHAIGRGSGAEFVTAGGVELSEVDPSTMQSRINPRVFFAGEVLNYDGYTGGFNLQAAWATGNIAGQNVLSAL